MKVILLVVLSVAVAMMACGPSSETVAKVDGQAISQAQLEAYFELKNIPKDNQERADLALTAFVERAALAKAIEKQGKLDETKITMEVDEFRKEMLISRYFDEFLKEQLTDAAVAGYYESRGDDYAETKVKVAHILVRMNRKMDESERTAQRTKIEEAHGKLRIGGADFAAVAKEYSEDAMSAANGGELGWIKKGSIDAAFSDKAFFLPVGQVSEPFETAFGYHIIKVFEAPRMEKKPLTAVQGDIRQTLRAAAKKAEMERLMKAVPFEVMRRGPAKKEEK